MASNRDLTALADGGPVPAITGHRAASRVVAAAGETVVPFSWMRERLAQAVAAAQETWAGKPVAWGQDDCAMACANVLRPVLGYDPAARWRGRYASAKGCLRVLRFDGLDGLAAAMAETARAHGWRDTPPHLAQAGDVGVFAHAGGQAAALALGNGWWIARMDCGFAARRADVIEQAWSVLVDAA